jgi:S1-C subfamily serine protease
VIGIHSGGEGRRTWTGLSFQVPDVVAGGHEVVAAGGQPVAQPSQLVAAVERSGVGKPLLLTVSRGGRVEQVEVVPAELGVR